MGISRRGFLGAAAGGVTSCLPRFVGRAPWGSAELGGARWPPRPAEHSSRYVLLDLKTPLTESIAGYQRALAQFGDDFVTLPPQPLAQQSACPVAIVPGCVMMDLGAASWLTALLDKGGLVVIESGAAFAEAAEFLAHQQLLVSRFGLRVGPPVNLWPEADPLCRLHLASPHQAARLQPGGAARRKINGDDRVGRPAAHRGKTQRAAGNVDVLGVPSWASASFGGSRSTHLAPRSASRGLMLRQVSLTEDLFGKGQCCGAYLAGKIKERVTFHGSAKHVERKLATNVCAIHPPRQSESAG